MSPRGLRGLRLAALVLVGLVSLAVVETLLRAFDLPAFDACENAPDWAVPDPDLGYRGDPSRDVAGITPNALGLRGPLPQQPEGEDETRILFVGDSTCFGVGVDLDETFAARATAGLTALWPDRPAHFVLGAFPGYSSHHSAILLDRLLPLQPDLVVLYVGARNDGDSARYYPDAEIPARRARTLATWHRVRLLRVLEALLDLGHRKLLRRVLPETVRARVPPPAFRANVEHMLARLHSAGVPALIVLPPISPHFEARQPIVRRYRELLEETAAAHGVPTVSLDAAFAQPTSEPLFFDDGFHLAPAGHALVAAGIRATVEAGMLEQGLQTPAR